MDGKELRKVPPNRPSHELVLENYKKKNKKKNGSVVTMDTDGSAFPSNQEASKAMVEPISVETQDTSLGNVDMVHKEPVKMITDGKNGDEVGVKGKGKSISYLESFLGPGFNGVANRSQAMDEDELLSDLLNKSWDVPQTPKEPQELMHLYPFVPIEQDEYDK